MYPAVRQIEALCIGRQRTTARQHFNRSIISRRANVGFIPAIRLAPLGSPDAVPSFLGKRFILSFNPLSGNRSGLQCVALRLVPGWGCVFRPCSASLASPASHLVRPLLTPPRRSMPVARHSALVLRPAHLRGPPGVRHVAFPA